MQELFVKHKELQLCVQTFGLKSNPAIVLITGSAGQAILWNKNFCQNLAKAGYHIIRFDNRDTGKSSGIDYDSHPYILKDMAEDIIAILDHFKIKKAHIIGSSMGGYIAQKLAFYYPSHVATLCLFMTSINSLALRGIKGAGDLPGHDLEIMNQISDLYKIPRLTLEDRINTLIQTWQIFNGKKAEFSYDEWYPIAQESYKRAKTKNAVKNHRLAVSNSIADRTEQLKDIDIPTLIIHGKEDQIIDPQHAYYAQKHIPNSKLVIIDKMGHLLSSLFIAEVEDAVLKHIKSNN